MLIAVTSGFVFALVIPLIMGRLKSKSTLWAALLPLSIFVFFLSILPEIQDNGHIRVSYQWVPSIGVNLDFYLDGLSMLFVLLISGIGTLVFIYTSAYLKGHHFLDRFYAYLSMFMASMLGLVLSDNIYTLFIFWELTSISSFFLIGFNNDSEASRKSALTALAITGIGGLFLLAAMVGLGHVTQLNQISAMSSLSEVIQGNNLYGWILLFLFLAAFTKSAQFPFHFWLPGAMKAPTPVSTYLHSATMVKAGIYLLARFTPVLGNHEWWNGPLIIVGAITMVYAAIHALFRLDLKGILAYSTISALGILVFLIGLGSSAALLAAAIFILVHALYKATLFLVTGIIDHETGTRDVSQLRGLNKVMLPVGIAALLAAISNAGIPPSFGFVGKDLIYAATLGMGDLAWPLTILAIITNVALLFAGFLAGIKPFFGKLPERFQNLHLPGPAMYAPPLLLGILCILFGLAPFLLEISLIHPVVAGLTGTDPDFHLQLWHGFNLILLLSVITIGSGTALYFILKPSENLLSKVNAFEGISPESIVRLISRGFAKFSSGWTRFFQNGYLRYYLITILGFISLMLAYRLFTGITLYVDTSTMTTVTFYEAVVLIIMAVAIFFTVFSKSRLVAVASMGVVGYSFCLIFLFYSAPDLAMTQFSIDTLTVILFVLVLYNLPKYLKLSDTRDRIRDGLLSLAFGTLISILTLEVMNETVSKETSQYYAENAYILGKGKNVVNVILVDFRGFDTMVEITVLAIAAIGVFGLLKLHLRSTEKE
ncbi:putative monovalent cation/H+ antiporter subunit A [Cyclobacterium sp.]|uniref:putative monovalent cation/H+ antiporter subunit A n=1 Tax=Cyclobacterium sp. TaxID=1966343 RepID=UPI00199781ED|nr:putative monovalent cation/H+ antiporter subunit A [Cyclobacterium sp.]MBD3627142.1 putative monovalent cation/H+ antiporter subunit A [Cyclobacterium sp.]